MSEQSRTASAWGLATVHGTGDVLDAWYPKPVVGEPSSFDPPAALVEAQYDDAIRQIESRVVRTDIRLDEPATGVEDAYLRLHLLSHRLLQPHELNLEGITGKLPITAFTSHGPVRPEDLNRIRAILRARGEQLTVHSLDRFPRMLDYVLPPNVVVADGSQVRLGASLAPGTIVAHSGLVDTGAGTTGACLIRGRLATGVFIGKGTEVGGGASIQGTPLDSGSTGIHIGENCLIGAQAGLGISLGDDCVVEAGLYVTAGAKVTLPDRLVVKARELWGLSDLQFRRDSISGAIVVAHRRGEPVTTESGIHRPA